MKSNIWWSERRKVYNISLIIAGFISFFLYVLIGVIFIMPYDKDFVITFSLYGMGFQLVGFFIFLIAANIFYTLGYFTDILFNKNKSEKFRLNLFRTRYVFSISIILLIPIQLLIRYFIYYY